MSTPFATVDILSHGSAARRNWPIQVEKSAAVFCGIHRQICFIMRGPYRSHTQDGYSKLVTGRGLLLSAQPRRNLGFDLPAS